MFLNEFETQVEMIGADYNALISYEWDATQPIIYRVEISRTVNHYYNADGKYAPHVERIILDITKFMDDCQIAAFADAISEDAAIRAAESKAEAKLERQLDRWNYQHAA